MAKYSEELINSITVCFKEENNHVIGRETAISYLETFARTFLAYVRVSAHKSSESVDIKQ
jgi:hypothetical protein